MPRISDPNPRDPYPGTLAFERENETSLDVYYVPSTERLQERRASSDNLDNPRARLLRFNAQSKRLTIFPIRTKNTIWANILEPKYGQIERITLASGKLLYVDFDGELPSSEHEVMEVLEELPSCFVKDFDFGLGMTQRHRFLVDAVEELTNCNEILISDAVEIPVDTNQGTFVISESEFESIRKMVNRVNTNGMSDIRDVTHDNVRNRIAKAIGQPLLLPRPKSLQSDNSGRTNTRPRSFSQSEHGLAFDIVSQNSRSIAKANPSEFASFQRDLQLVSLDSLIEQYEGMMNKRRLPEGIWQKFLEENSFVLNSAFGYPIVHVQDQPSVGGRGLSGTGGKVADFLLKHSLTHNAAIVEIKKPSTKLLNDKQYRSGVFIPSRDLSGAINQALTQKYHLEQEIAQIKENSGERDLSTYSVHCFLLIGTMPPNREQMRSFEIFRGNSKDVVVMTFDELLEKIKQIRAFLTLQETSPMKG